jgi:signal transduction histidine kinase
VLPASDDDTGTAKAHVRLTEWFCRVDEGRFRSAGETGLGLAIVTHFVHRHSGQLAIDSEGARARPSPSGRGGGAGGGGVMVGNGAAPVLTSELAIRAAAHRITA